MINFSKLTDSFSDISALDALECLCWTFNADKAGIYLDGTTLVLSDLYDYISLEKAADIELRFYGGPNPGKWWNGTLLTLFLDHFIYAYLKGKRLQVTKALQLSKHHEVIC